MKRWESVTIEILDLPNTMSAALQVVSDILLQVLQSHLALAFPAMYGECDWYESTRIELHNQMFVARRTLLLFDSFTLLRIQNSPSFPSFVVASTFVEHLLLSLVSLRQVGTLSLPSWILDFSISIDSV